MVNSVHRRDNSKRSLPVVVRTVLLDLSSLVLVVSWFTGLGLTEEIHDTVNDEKLVCTIVDKSRQISAEDYLSGH